MHRVMMNALGHIRQLDYTVIYARDLPAMRHFYEKVMEFPVINVLSETWIEFGLGANRLALTVYGGRFKDVACDFMQVEKSGEEIVAIFLPENF